MNDPKPTKLHGYTGSEGADRAFYRVPTTAMHHEFRNGLVRHGEFYFTSNQFMDVIGLAFESGDRNKAVDQVLTFNKWLNTLKMQWFNIGYVLFPDDRLAFTYSVQSTRHKNDPLVVHEIIVPVNDPDAIAIVELSDGSRQPSGLDIQIYQAVNNTASTWISAYRRRPEADILKVSNGK